MKKSNFLVMFLLAVVTLAVVSCQTGNSEFPGYETAESGMIYKFHKYGEDTVTPKAGDFVEINLTYKTEDTVMFASSDLPPEQKGPIPMGRTLFAGDIFDGLGMMHVGDSATFVVAADSVWKYMYRGNVPPGMDSAKYIFYIVGLNNIMSAEEMNAIQGEKAKVLMEEEQVNRETYLKENYPDAKPTESGLYYVRTKKGSGSNPQVDQTVSVHYTGTLLNGTKFDSSVDRGTPFEFPLGQGRVIKGWDEGIAMMKKGEKGVLIVPSDLGYGSRPSGPIPPHSTLVFEVELIDFKNAN